MKRTVYFVVSFLNLIIEIAKNMAAPTPFIMGNPIYMIIWLLVFIFVSFFVAGFCAFWYIIIFPFTVCIPDLSKITDLLLSGVQFPKFCAEGLMEGKPLF